VRNKGLNLFWEF